MKLLSFRVVAQCAVFLIVTAPYCVRSQVAIRPQQTPVSQAEQGVLVNSQTQAETELQTGITLTRRGSFRDVSTFASCSGECD